MKHNLLKSLIISVILLTGVSNAWAWNFTKGTVIYFENTLNWNNINLRVGTSSNQIWSNTYTDWTKVPGTESLYKLTLPECDNYEAFSFANNSGWTGDNTIYQPYYKNGEGVKPDGQYTITEQTVYFEWHLNHTRMFIPASFKNTEHGCKYFNTTVIDNTDTHPDYYKNTVNIISHKGGTVTISYTDENGSTITKTDKDGSFTVAQTCILTITKIQANPGYKFNKIYVKPAEEEEVVGREKQVGDTCIIRANEDIVVEFVTTNPQKVQLKLDHPDWLQKWDDKDAKIIAFVWKDTYSSNSTVKAIEMTKLYGNKYECDIPAGFYKISFKRFSPEANIEELDWSLMGNQTIDLDFVDVNNKCYVINQRNTKYEGYITQPTYSVVLDKCEFGTYRINYNGIEYTSSRENDNIIDVPIGSTVRFLGSQSDNDAYTETVIVGRNTEIQASTNQEFTITDHDLIFDDFFLTKEPHIVYLGVPESLKAKWEEGQDNNVVLAYAQHQYNTVYGAICKVENSITRGDVTYYQFTIPAGWNNFRFERKTDDVSYGTYPIKTSIYFPFGIPTDENNCFTLTGGEGWGFTGQWGTSPKCTVTLGYCEFGTYSIEYDAHKYFAKQPNSNVSISIPLGHQIKILEGQPASDAYTGDIVQIGPNQQLETNQLLTVSSDITLDDNFVTKEDHIVYLGIPKELYDDTWKNNGTTTDPNDNTIYDFTYHIYRNNRLGSIMEACDQGEYLFERNNIRYYKFNIKKGYYSIQFQRKIKGAWNDGAAWSTSIWLPFQIPLTEVNCFTLKNETDDVGRYKGEWGILPADEGDFRVLYVEQVVEKATRVGEEWKTETRRTKCHPSDIIKKGDDGKIDIVSLHINTAGDNPEIILQQYQNVDGIYKWVDIQANMVNGPLEGLPIMANLPGRKNASPGSEIDDFVYDDGIEKIKEDTKYASRTRSQEKSYKGSGVWNFAVVQNGTEAIIDMNHKETKRYEGNYYIRSFAAEGGWNCYTIPSSHMTYSNYSENNSHFSHYFCRWIQNSKNKHGKYTIANDYSSAISDTLEADITDLFGNSLRDDFGNPLGYGDVIVDENCTLPEDANVRFSWEEMTNKLHRAYMRGSTNVSDRFLVLEGKEDQLFNAEGQALTKGANGSDRFGLNANEEIFKDLSNWLYYTDVQMRPGADLRVTAAYGKKDNSEDKIQYFIGNKTTFSNNILQGTGNQPYLIRLLYDFKTNELISAYVPDNKENIEPIQTNLMLIRTEDYKNSEEETNLAQLGFTTNEMKDENQRAYGVLEITENRLTSTLPYSARTLYWVSFPFDVRVSDVFSSAVYGKHWIIQSYNGAKRAAEGLYLDSDSNWEYHFDPNKINEGDSEYQGVLKKGVGYVVALNYVNIEKDQLLETTDVIALYFPSTTPISNHITNNASITINVPEHNCNIKNREIADSHWNVIGVPAYKNAGINFENNVTTFANVTYYYKWLGERNLYQAVEGKEQKFDPLHSYMVQYYGDLNWTSIVNEGPAPLTAKRNTKDTEKHQLRLELQQNAQEQDRTFIQLQDEEATARFDFNYDLCKIKNSGANIYSIITTESTPIQVAGNVMPIQETIIPLGIKTDAAGEYTFAMPDGTDGIVVELIDYETNTRTNMLLDNYTVTLGKGTFENRFALHVKPSKVVTGVDDLNGGTSENAGVKKYLIDGVLYMQKDGVLYDAQGKLVR